MAENCAQKILVVDGGDDTRQLICLALQQAGFEAFPAASGAVAIEQVNAHDTILDLVLMEMALPDMDGEALFAAIHERQPQLHFLVFTGECDLDALQRLLDTGYCAHLGKPRPLAELLEEVQWVVSLHPRTKPA